MEKTYNVLFAGVGGQGIVLASRILAEAAFRDGFDVKESEIHGMAQRGGSVIGEIRFGKKVYSPAIPPESADILVALEEAESLRYLSRLKKDATIILNLKKIPPMGLNPGDYPQNIPQILRERGFVVKEIEGEKIAREVGNPKVENAVILGLLSNFLPLSFNAWEEAIKNLVPPKTIELNLKAFSRGKSLGEQFFLG